MHGLNHWLTANPLWMLILGSLIGGLIFGPLTNEIRHVLYSVPARRWRQSEAAALRSTIATLETITRSPQALIIDLAETATLLISLNLFLSFVLTVVEVTNLRSASPNGPTLFELKIHLLLCSLLFALTSSAFFASLFTFLRCRQLRRADQVIARLKARLSTLERIATGNNV